jgi:hypothetical protein
MLSRELALALRGAGLPWTPAKGDWFFVPDRDLDEHEFVVSDMVIEVLDVLGVGRILAFNGTTEWALDSLEASAAVWLPREDQLRALLGADFVSCERLAVDPEGYAVTVRRGARTERYVDVAPEAAYARAVLGTR